jgi:DNA-binding transcriptional ArsR family regulator
LTGDRTAPILNRMVSRSSTLDRTFAAIADPTRRAMLERLRRQRPLSVSELARPFPVSLPAILKHLNVLSAAGLIICEKSGRTVTCRLNARPMKGAMQWMGHYERYWSRKLDRLAAFVETERDE